MATDAISRQITLKPDEDWPKETWWIPCDGDGPELPRGIRTVINEVKCTCGVDAVGQGRHSDWCPKYTKEQK
jgi:hypothetical protein